MSPYSLRAVARAAQSDKQVQTLSNESETASVSEARCRCECARRLAEGE